MVRFNIRLGAIIMKILNLVLLGLAGLLVDISSAQTLAPSATNFSTLITLAPGGNAALGFTVASLPQSQPGAWYLIRAVGPTLTSFGVSSVEAKPSLVVYNSQGKAVTMPITINTYNWPAIFAATGAFQLNLSNSTDAYELLALPPGSYSAQVTDGSGKGGTVLIEAYLSSGPIYTGVQ